MRAHRGHRIRQALAVTRWAYGEPPELGMVTFVNRCKVKPKKDYGYCYLMAGFEPDGETKGGLLALRISPANMPPAEAPHGGQLQLIA